MCNVSTTTMPGGECCILSLARPHCIPLPSKGVFGLQQISRHTGGCMRLGCSRPHVHACPTGSSHATVAVCACKGLP